MLTAFVSAAQTSSADSRSLTSRLAIGSFGFVVNRESGLSLDLIPCWSGTSGSSEGISTAHEVGDRSPFVICRTASVTKEPELPEGIDSSGEPGCTSVRPALFFENLHEVGDRSSFVICRTDCANPSSAQTERRACPGADD
jgi:hypothetical protein